MANMLTKITAFFSRYQYWLVGISFVLFQFFLQLSSGVVIGAILADMHFSALIAGLLSGTFYVVYTGLQIPIGVLFDHKNTRHLLTSTVLLCSLGCFVFAWSHHLPGLFLGRLLMGTGAAFAFVGLAHIVRQHHPLKQFAFLMGLSETLGFVATAFGLTAMGALIFQCGWRCFMNGAGVLGLVIGYLCWTYLPNHRPPRTPKKGQPLWQIMRTKTAWFNGLFVGLSFTVVTVFGALWAVPFLQLKLHCALKEASLLSAIFFLGTALSCPLFGWLSMHLRKRRPLMLSSSWLTLIFLLMLLYLPITHSVVMGLLLFCTGISCGAYMLSYAIANELAPAESLSTCTGFTNMLAVVTTPLLQPLIGYLLDTLNPSGHYTLIDYQYALLTIPLFILIASFLVFFLPEKNETTM